MNIWRYISWGFSFFSLFLTKDKERIIIASYENKQFNFNSRVFFEYLISKGEENVYFVIEDKALRKELNKKYGDFFIGRNNFKDLYTIYTSKVWVVSTKPICMFPASMFDRYVINLWHGVPLKNIGVNDKFQSMIKRFLYKYYYSLFYTYVLSSSEYMVGTMAESFGVEPNRVLVAGVPVGEMFGASIDVDTNLLMKRVLSKRRYNILYAPTYRDFSLTKFFPFSDFDKQELQSFLKDNLITLFVRPHGLDGGSLDLSGLENVEMLSSNLVREVSFYLKEFDIVVGDYSSVSIDNLLNDNGNVYIPYDLQEFSSVRGLRIPFEDFCGGASALSFKEWKFHVLNYLKDPKYMYEEKHVVRKRFHDSGELQCNKILDSIRTLCN